MRLPRVRFTVRRMIAVVVVVSLALAAVTYVVRGVDRSLYEFYRPGGTLERIHKGMGDGSGARDDSGKPARVPVFAHASLAAYPNDVISTRNPETGMTFYVESNGRRLVALDRGGSLAWGVDVFEVDFKPPLGEPVVRHLQVVGGSVWATYGRSDYFRIDLLTGRTEYFGRD